MPEINFYWLFVSALVPLLVGSIYYNPKVLGKAGMSAAGVTEEQAKQGSMVKIFLLTYLFGLFVSYIIFLFAVHQSSVYQLFLHEKDLFEAGSELSEYVNGFMEKYGDRHRTFGHGVIHGVEITLLMGFGLIGINTLFERRPMRYLWIHLGFWVICGALMGGMLCAWM